MKLIFDAKVCAGHGRCYSISDQLMEADDEGHGVVLNEDVPVELEDLAGRTVGECPEGALRLA